MIPNGRALRARNWKPVQVPRPLAFHLPEVRCYQKDLVDGHLSVLVGPEPPGWHMSISHRRGVQNRPGRYPTWDEIREARELFCPADTTMAMLLPPLDEYINVHETTFHLWQVPNSIGFM